MLDHSDQKKNYRGHWITFMVAVPLLSIVCGAYAGFLYATRPTPEKTLHAFCIALQSGNDLQAFSQYSNAYQHTYPKQQFKSDMTGDKVISCTYGAIRLSGNKAITRIRLAHASGITNTETVILSQQGGSNNEWKIESGIHLSTPLETVNTFCNAVQKGDYRAAYGQLVSGYQRDYPEQQLASDMLLDKVISCTHTSIAMSGSNALTHLTLAHASRVTNNDLVTLSQDDNDVWKIANGIHLSTPLETVNAFCNAIQSGNYQMAYTQLSANFQSTVSARDFVSALAQSMMTSCSHNSLTISGTSATAILNLVNAFSPAYSEVVILVQDSSSDWKIEDVRLL
ncbi:MAG TPA: hypothetical protein VFN02_15045 [Ktedonobacteraceae bacterium]|nr:hypothetical protein [Ktedonobacteraceae bacterium]